MGSSMSTATTPLTSASPLPSEPALIQALYGGLTNKEGFHDFLELLAESINGCAAQLSTMRKAPLALEHLWHAGLSDEFIAWYLDNNMIEQDVVTNHAVTQSPGLFRSALPLLPDFDINEDYSRWESDQDMLDSAWLVVHSTDTHTILLTVQRTVAQGPYTSVELAQLNRLVPFVRQAIQLAEQLDQRNRVTTSLAGIIDALPDASFVLNDQASIVYTNKAAAALLQRERCLTISDQRLSFEEKDVQNAFVRSSVQVVRASMGKDLYRSDTLILNRRDRAPLLLVVRPIESEDLQLGGALVSVYDQRDRQFPSAELIGQYFSLTPAEAQVCADLVTGMSLKDIAQMRHKSELTLRTYVKHIFQKTNHTRQGELISSILSALMH